MPTRFVLLAKEYETEHGTFVQPWSGTFEDEDPIRDEFLELCEKGVMEVEPIRKPRKPRKPGKPRKARRAKSKVAVEPAEETQPEPAMTTPPEQDMEKNGGDE